MYQRANPGIWDAKYVGSNERVKDFQEEIVKAVGVRERLEVVLGLRHKMITETPHEKRSGVFTSRMLVRNIHMEEIPCVQFSNYFGNEAAPAVIILHDRWGLTPDILEMGRFLKQHGFHVAIPELYRGKRAFSHSQAADMAQRLDLHLAIDDVEAVMNELRYRSPYRTVGCIGVGSLGSEVALAAHAEFEKPDGNFDGIRLKLKGNSHAKHLL